MSEWEIQSSEAVRNLLTFADIWIIVTNLMCIEPNTLWKPHPYIQTGWKNKAGPQSVDKYHISCHANQSIGSHTYYTSSNAWLCRCFRRGCSLYRVVDTFSSRWRCVVGPTCDLWASYPQTLLNWHDFYSLDKPDWIAQWPQALAHVHQVAGSSPDQGSHFFCLLDSRSYYQIQYFGSQLNVFHKENRSFRPLPPSQMYLNGCPPRNTGCSRLSFSFLHLGAFQSNHDTVAVWFASQLTSNHCIYDRVYVYVIWTPRHLLKLTCT